MRSWRQRALWMAKLNAALLIVDILFLGSFLLLTNSDVRVVVNSGYLSMVLLLESGISFLVGGLAAMSSSLFMSKVREHFLRPESSRSEAKDSRTMEKANLIILLAVVLFLEATVASFVSI